MKKVRLKNGFAKVEVKNNRYLICVCYNGAYDLKIEGYNSKMLMTGLLYENAKRISTINKYANDYGVEFVA